MNIPLIHSNKRIDFSFPSLKLPNKKKKEKKKRGRILYNIILFIPLNFIFAYTLQNDGNYSPISSNNNSIICIRYDVDNEIVLILNHNSSKSAHTKIEK